MLIGLESGKYDIGVKGAWYTAERAEKFVIPDEAIGASVIALPFVKKMNQNTQISIHLLIAVVNSFQFHHKMLNIM